MITFNNLDVHGIENAMRGMRNPMNSWSRNDSYMNVIGEKDLELATRLAKAGTEHRKYARQIMVWIDIKAPLYFWTEFDTHKISTTSNSCSTMHKLLSRHLNQDDFSIHIPPDYLTLLNHTIDQKDLYVAKNLLPCSYLQTRTVTMNYEVLLNMIRQREHHKLPEWREFCEYMLEYCPYLEELYNATKI